MEPIRAECPGGKLMRLSGGGLPEIISVQIKSGWIIAIENACARHGLALEIIDQMQEAAVRSLAAYDDRGRKVGPVPYSLSELDYTFNPGQATLTGRKEKD